MGNRENKRRLDAEHASLMFTFESPTQTYDSEHPICGTVHLKCSKVLAAYCLTLKLELVDQTRKVDHGDKGQRYVHDKKERVFDKSQVLINFENNTVQPGNHAFPFTF